MMQGETTQHRQPPRHRQSPISQSSFRMPPRSRANQVNRITSNPVAQPEKCQTVIQANLKHQLPI